MQFAEVCLLKVSHNLHETPSRSEDYMVVPIAKVHIEFISVSKPEQFVEE